MFAKIETTISETIEKGGKRERQEIGKVEYLVPMLDEFGLTGETKTDDDGEVSYADPKLNWLYGAVQSAVRSLLVSRLEPRSVRFREGYTAWTDFATMVATSGNRGAALVLRREFIASFTAFIAKLGKSEKWSNAMVAFASSAKALAGTTVGNKEVFQKNLNKFFDQLTEADQEKFANIIAELVKVSSAEELSLEDE